MIGKVVIFTSNFPLHTSHCVWAMIKIFIKEHIIILKHSQVRFDSGLMVLAIYNYKSKIKLWQSAYRPNIIMKLYMQHCNYMLTFLDHHCHHWYLYIFVPGRAQCDSGRIRLLHSQLSGPAQASIGSCPHLCVKHKKCPRTKYLRETHLSEL